MSEASPDTNDLLFGGDGNDLIFGGNAADTIHGDNHNDTLHGDVGNDVLYGGDGADAAYGGDGNDLVLGEANNDSLYGDAGEDTLDGGVGNDIAYGGANNDVITGGAGSDHLYGDAGNDLLNGSGGGADTLTGGTGDDLFVLSGGAGDSVFLSDFGAGETAGANITQTDNDFVDLTPWYNDSTLALYNSTYGTSFTNPLQAMQHDAATSTPGTLNFIAFQGGPTVTFTLVGSGVMDTEHTGVPCFTRGTMIETARGDVAIEDLRRGDLVRTADHGLQPIRWIGSRRLAAGDLAANPKLRPIRIRAGALGRGLPLQDVVVSPQHRVLVSSKVAERMFGEREVLVPARHLLLINGIDVAEEMAAVEYFHILFDRHQIVFAAGAPMESLFTGPEALKSVGPEARREIFEIFPELETLDATALPQPARPIQSGRIARKLAARHVQNGMTLIGH
ncbi:Hint domain-containing protein [Pseudogemmobacter blasticus]|uniref:Hint domain-containing protein n=1 Tax=Fuscovulum blasticum TaxID=1075 RepID=UPI0015E6FCDB|nr:Hint domain-containing protein [Fuscovulum blasticum]